MKGKRETIDHRNFGEQWITEAGGRAFEAQLGVSNSPESSVRIPWNFTTASIIVSSRWMRTWLLCWCTFYAGIGNARLPRVPCRQDFLFGTNEWPRVREKILYHWIVTRSDESTSPNVFRYLISLAYRARLWLCQILKQFEFFLRSMLLDWIEKYVRGENHAGIMNDIMKI